MQLNNKYLRTVYKDLLDSRLASTLDTSVEAFAEFETILNRASPADKTHELLREAVRFHYKTDGVGYERWLNANRMRHFALWADCGLTTRVLGLDGIAFIRFDGETGKYIVDPHPRAEDTVAEARNAVKPAEPRRDDYRRDDYRSNEHRRDEHRNKYQPKRVDPRERRECAPVPVAETTVDERSGAEPPVEPSARGYAPREYPPREYPRREKPVREYPPRGYAPREYAPREYAPREQPVREYPPRGYVPREYAPRNREYRTPRDEKMQNAPRASYKSRDAKPQKAEKPPRPARAEKTAKPAANAPSASTTVAIAPTVDVTAPGVSMGPAASVTPAAFASALAQSSV